MPDPANVAANWAKYFDDTHQCYYYYNSVTQESSWSRPACLEFVKTHSQKSSSLLSAAFGSGDENEDDNTNEIENEQSTEPLGQASPNPPAPSVKSPKESKRSDIGSSFDSNDEFFAQLEEEVETANKETSEEEKARIKKREEEEKAQRQAELDKIEEERAQLAAVKETEATAKRKAEEEAELAAQRETERLEEEAKAKRQEELNKIAEEQKKADRLREQAEIEAAELKVKQAEKEKQQAELERFKAQKKAEMEAKKKAEEEAELARVKEKEEAALRRKAEVEKLTSGVDDKADEIDDDDEVIDYTLSVSKTEESPREIDDESDVQIIKEKAEVVSEVEDTVEHHRAATQLQALQRGRLAKKRVHSIKKDAKKKRYDEFMNKQEEKEKEVIAMQIKNGVNNNARMDAAAVKLQSLQRQRSTQKEVKQIKKQKNEAAVKLQALHRRRASQRRFREMKLERPHPQKMKASSSHEQELPAINDSDVSGQSSAASLHAKPHHIEIKEIKSTPDVKVPLKVVPVAQPKPEVVLSKKNTQPAKPKVVKKAPRNNPRDAIAEAARFLEENEKNINDPNKQPTVPETKSDELTLPEISCSPHEPQVIRRKKRNNGLNHVNKHTMESLEKLEQVAKKTAPPPMESKSAPPSGSPLPRIRPPRVAETERRKKKEPLFMRLEAQARQRSMAIEKEKRDNYLKLKESKKEAKPSREAIMEHMRKYDEDRKAHVNKEREYAEAKKKEWQEKAKKLKSQNKSPPHRKKLWDSESVSSDEPGNKKKKQESHSHAKPGGGEGALIISPRRVKKKLFRKKKKLDFVEEEKERKAQEEQAKKDRLAKGKMYGKVAPAKHAKNVTPVKKKLNLIDEIEIPSSPYGGPVAQSIIPSPRSPRNEKVSRRISTSEDVDTDEARDVLRSPVNPEVIRTSPGNVNKAAPNPRQRRLSRGRSANHDADALSPVLSVPKGSKKRSPIKSRLSSLEDSSNSVFNVDAPYDGIVGSEWVSQVMEMDTEEATLADVYESGFEMFMIEKGIIQDVV
mmetsp:Transcript_7764/g.14627  ORF Transcript_7764/g.14627 Transcript_7764/m.14627 type:complete len:1026 (+) Transcript_7764:93-3170(+)